MTASNSNTPMSGLEQFSNVELPDPSFNRLMVDIETLGTGPGAVILSIGAVMFSDGEITDEFYRNINLHSSLEAGLEIDAYTLEWWLDQDEDVKDILTGGVPLQDALYDFDEFALGADEIWAKPPSFDCVILEAAYEAIDQPVPWEYNAKRDLRTLETLPGEVDVEMEGNVHNALDDATVQARVVMKKMSAYADLLSMESE